MDQDCINTQIHDIKYTAGINQRYHQICEWRWEFADKSLRILVGILAVVEFWSSVRNSQWDEWLSFASIVAAVALNVVSMDRSKVHAELFHRWSDLRRGAEVLQTKVAHSMNNITCIRERIQEMIETEHSLCGSEPAPWRRLLARCQEDENEAVYGVRQYCPPPATSSEVVSAGAG